MHKLMEYICNELEELERKAGKDGKLSMAEIEYADKLAHMKKNLLKADEMWQDSEYSEAMEGGQNRGGSYARRSYARGGMGGIQGTGRSGAYEGSYGSYEGGSMARGRGRNAKRDSMGRYSRAEGAEMMVEELRELMQDAPDEQTRMEFQKFIQRIEQM